MKDKKTQKQLYEQLLDSKGKESEEVLCRYIQYSEEWFHFNLNLSIITLQELNYCLSDEYENSHFSYKKQFFMIKLIAIVKDVKTFYELITKEREIIVNKITNDKIQKLITIDKMISLYFFNIEKLFPSDILDNLNFHRNSVAHGTLTHYQPILVKKGNNVKLDMKRHESNSQLELEYTMNLVIVFNIFKANGQVFVDFEKYLREIKEEYESIYFSL